MQTDGSVLIADGDEAPRTELRRVLGTAGWGVIQAADGPEALRLARVEQPLAVILEIALDGLSGYEVCRALKAEFGAQLPVVFLTGARIESFDRVAGLLIGADDYVVKPFAPDELLVRLRNLVARVQPDVQATRAATLTRREREILSLLSQGIGQREIARRLFISPKTVGTHVENLTRKLGVNSRVEAVALAFREHLLNT